MLGVDDHVPNISPVGQLSRQLLLAPSTVKKTKMQRNKISDLGPAL